MDGLIKYLRYGFAPNQLSYCGPRDSKAILDYLKAGKADRGLRQLLVGFKGALPYLKFIARQNKISDPFDERVVEAYWLGNDLLAQCDLKDFYQDLRERFRKMVSPKTLKLILGAVPVGVAPHHSFHVLQVFFQTGGMEKNFEPSLEMVNNCLIRAGEVKSKTQIKCQKLELRNRELKFAPSVETVKTLDSSQCKNGDWVSLHWGWVCEVITLRQKKQLEKWTGMHLGRMV